MNPNRLSVFNTSVLKSLDTQLCKLAPGTQHEKWMPWVNSYPEPWRLTFTSCSSGDWVMAHSLLQEIQMGAVATCQATEQGSPSNIPDVPTSVNVRSWIGAVKILFRSSRKKGTGCISRDTFCWVMGAGKMERFLETFPPFEEEPFVADFRRTLQESYHKCYDAKNWSWHASALWLATGYDCNKVMSSVGGPPCIMCRLRNFVTVGKHSPDEGAQARLDSLLLEVVRHLK